MYTGEPSCPMTTHGKSQCQPPLTFKKKIKCKKFNDKVSAGSRPSAKGGGEGGRSFRPWDKGEGPGLQKNIFGPFGPHLGLKILGIRHCFSCYLKLGTAGVGNACITLRFHPWGEGFRSLIKPTEYQHQLQNENKDIHCDALEEARLSD